MRQSRAYAAEVFMKVLRKQANSKSCIICGMDNPLGVKAPFYEMEDNSVVTLFSYRSEHQSYPGRAHGGMITCMLDELIDKSMSGQVDETACDNIVAFLKVDISICDALLGMDYSSLDSILDGFRRILSIIDEAPEPHSQNIYSRSLTPEQSLIEYGYNKVIEHIQDVMLRRYANML